MSRKRKTENPKELEKIEDALTKTEIFIENNLKNLGIALLAIVVIISAFFLYKNKYIAPRDIKAQEQLFLGERYFQKDSFEIALNGNEADYIGFKNIAKKYSMTPTANTAKIYAGISYFKIGEQKNAYSYLKKSNVNDKFLSPLLQILIGDYFVENGQINKAIKQYKKASKVDNKETAAYALKKLGQVYESQKRYDKAIESYTTIKDLYPTSVEAYDIEKYIAKATLLKFNSKK